MLQTASASGSSQAPLQGRVVTLEAEMTSLEERTTALEDSLGAGGGGAAPAAELQMDKKKEPFAHYALLLKRANTDSAALNEDIASLETRAAAVKSKILTLENQVSGNAFAVKMALLSEGVQGARKGSSLESRFEALEDETVDLRTRVTSLEQTVVGLQVKAQ